MALAQPSIFQGGTMTLLPSYPGGLDLTALMEIVSPGIAGQGVNYSGTLPVIAALLNGAGFSAPTFIKTAGSYASVATDTRILSDLSVAGAVNVTMLASSSYTQPILVKDVTGTLSAGNPLTITFSGSQKLDGQSSVVLNTAYQWIWLNPLAAGGFYET